MAQETKEEFLTRWRAVVADAFGEDAPEELVTRAGESMYAQRAMTYEVGNELNLPAHRFFHGMAAEELNFMLQLPMTDIIPFVVSEYMFHLGFTAATAYAADPESTFGMAGLEETVECIGDGPRITRSRADLTEHEMPLSIQLLVDFQTNIRAVTEQMKKAAAKQKGAAEQPPEGGGPPAKGGGYF